MGSGRVLRFQKSLPFHQGTKLIGTMIIISIPSQTRPKVKSLRQALTSEEFHPLRNLKYLVKWRLCSEGTPSVV
jgi:hypothetical protein